MKKHYTTWGGISLPKSYFVVFSRNSSPSPDSEHISIKLCVDDESDVVGEYRSTGLSTWRCRAREDFEIGDPETIACRMFRDTDPNDAPEYQDWLQQQ